jgi:lysozyme
LALGDASRQSIWKEARMSNPANVVVDLSHHNGDVDLQRAKAAGVMGVIQKATQGQSFKDPTYDVNRAAAAAAGLLWGAYHFGTGSSGVTQAEWFLNTVQPSGVELLVLDFESNPQGPSMDLEEARAFVTHINERTGLWPGLYGGHFIKSLLGTGNDPVLKNCWFWLAQYGPTAVVPSNWDSWTFWQYTDGALGPTPHEIDGIGRCDRNFFDGDEEDLGNFWRIQGASIPTS